MRLLRNVSIKRKLIAITMLTAIVGLALASAALAVFELISYRKDEAQKLLSLAKIIGANSVASLEFKDARAAGETLEALRTGSRIVSARLYDAEGAAFVTFQQGGNPSIPLPSKPEPDGEYFKNGYLVLFHPVMLDHERVGTIYIQASLKGINARLQLYGLVTFLIIIGSLLVSYPLSSKLQAMVSDPILHLAGIARRVSAEKNYSLRAVKQSEDELGVLVEQFNEMLNQIQEKDAALQKAYDEMEHRVKERTRELQRSNQELTDFASIASHDLQEPLRKIIAFSDRLKVGYESALDEKARDYLDRMQGASARMQSLIADLLRLSRVTTKAQPFAPVDLTEAVEEALEDLEVSLKNSGGTVKIESLPTVMADSSQMRQLFQNLIGNALKYRKAEEAPVVTLAGKLVDGRLWEIRVEDNGIGFDQKYAERIFKPFERLHGRSQFEGSGVGLAICQKIVVRHGGRITAQSEPHKGSKFIITLPIRPD